MDNECQRTITYDVFLTETHTPNQTPDISDVSQTGDGRKKSGKSGRSSTQAERKKPAAKKPPVKKEQFSYWFKYLERGTQCDLLNPAAQTRAAGNNFGQPTGRQALSIENSEEDVLTRESGTIDELKAEETGFPDKSRSKDIDSEGGCRCQCHLNSPTFMKKQVSNKQSSITQEAQFDNIIKDPLVKRASKKITAGGEPNSSFDTNNSANIAAKQFNNRIVSSKIRSKSSKARMVPQR